MTERKKVYSINMPFTLAEWRKGARYMLTKMTTEEVKIIYHGSKKDGGLTTTTTHKVLNVKNRLPFLLRKLIPNDACTVDEFSTNIDTLLVDMIDTKGEAVKAQLYNIETRMENKEGLLGGIKADVNGVIDRPEAKGDLLENIIEKETGEAKEAPDLKNLRITSDSSTIFLNSENAIKRIIEADQEIANACSTVYRNRYFDSKSFRLEVKTHVSTQSNKSNIFNLKEVVPVDVIDVCTYKDANIEEVGDRDYRGDWKKRYPVLTVYKLIDVEVNNKLFGRLAKEIERMLRDLLVDVQQNILKSYDEWSKISDEQLLAMEQEMIRKFVGAI